MASGSTSISGRNLTANFSYESVLQNYNNSGKDYILRRIEIQGNGGGYVTVVNGNSGGAGTITSGSYTWTYPYGSYNTWDSRGYYSEVNTGANGGYDRTASGSGTIGPAPAPSTPSTPTVYASDNGGGYIYFSWGNVGASGYSYSGSANGSTSGTSLNVYVGAGNTGTLTVQAYNNGDGVNTVGTSYSGSSSASAYAHYPAPSTPASPSVSGSYSGSTVSFSWNSTGQGYSVYVNGSYYTSTSANSVSITGRALGSTTTCYVQAYNSNADGATASSANSNTSSVYIPNPPSAPAVPTLSGSVSGTTVTLSWSNVSASGYYIYRNGSYLKTVTGAVTTTDTGLTKGTTYGYYVVAYNSNGDGSASAANSNTVSEYVLNPPAAPSATSLTATAHANGDGTVDLSWSAQTCTGYRVYKDGSLLSSTSATGLSNTGNARASTHSFYVQTYNTNADGTTLGAASNTTNVTIPDVPAAPSAPTLSGSADPDTGVVTLSWTNVGASFYDVYRDGALLKGGVSDLSYSDSTAAANATYGYYVVAFNVNAVGKSAGAQSNTVTLTVPVPPPPSAPSVPTVNASAVNTQAAPNYYGTISVTWTNVGATGYRVYRNGSLLTTTPSTAVAVSNVPYDEVDTFYVIAYNQNAGGKADAAASNTASVTVPRPNPPAAPATPSTPTLSASSKYQAVTVTWTNVGVSGGYRVYRNGSLVSTTGSTTVTFSETRPAETYTTYYVVPFNSATNPGGTTTTDGSQSNSKQVLTKALPPHSVGILMG